MRVFISHASKDKPAVLALAEALRGHGIDPWVDKWEIGPADDIPRRINQGLHEADAGIIVFSANSQDSHWIDAEVSYLTWARIEEGKPLIPVSLGDKPFIPPLLRPLIRYDIGQVQAIADALHNRRPGPATPLGTGPGTVTEVEITLRPTTGTGLSVQVRIGDNQQAATELPGLPPDLLQACESFVCGRRDGVHRDFRAADHQAQEALAALGQKLGALCLPGDAAGALTALIDGCPVGTLLHITFAAADPALLGLPFEATCLPDGRVLALQAPVVTLRRALDVTPPKFTPLAGPLKLLLAVAVPDPEQGGGAVLDYERETQNVLDAVKKANQQENCQVRILEIADPIEIGKAFQRDAYHVLHLSCHGGPGVVVLEDEDGKPVPTDAKRLLDPIRQAGKPLPLVLLSACDTGVPGEQTASLAHELLRGGVPAVLAMQAPVSDTYAIALADAFYRALSAGEPLPPSRALALARKDIEQARQKAAQGGGAAATIPPEYATAALFVAGAEQPLADFHLDKVPLNTTPVHEVSGVVPQLPAGELIGRRAELRAALRALRDTSRRRAGIVLTGIGGIGKSALAGRLMARLAEDGWLPVALRGPFDLTQVAQAIGDALDNANRDPDLAAHLQRADLQDRQRLTALGGALTQHSVLLVLDDFEQNLTTGGGAFLNPDIADQLRAVAAQARAGRLLLTCRYPLPGLDDLFQAIEVPPLSPAEIRKKLLRLPALATQAGAVVTALRVIGGHPRMLEFLDALLRTAPERAGPMALRLADLAKAEGVDIGHPMTDLPEATRRALALGALDIVLPELLEIVQAEGYAAALLQAAVSNLPVTAPVLARMLAEPDAGDPAAAETALARLDALSLLHLGPQGALVHRWTAEALRAWGGEAAFLANCRRAAAVRLQLGREDRTSYANEYEALRNFLIGGALDEAADLAGQLLLLLDGAGQSLSVAALAAEVLETLPESHSGFAGIADLEAQAHQALGDTDRAMRRYLSLLNQHENRAKQHPTRADYQRDLSVSYIKMGDLYTALGQGDAARDAFAKALAIREALARAEPSRADYLDDLATSLERIGDTAFRMGQTAAASAAYLRALEIREALRRAESQRADHQRRLSVTYIKMGDLYAALGQGDAARDAFAKALAIHEALAHAEPARADYQRDLSVSYIKMGDLYAALGQGDNARDAFAKALAIAEALARAEPARADYQRDLSVSYIKMGDLYRALGQGDAARDAFAKALAIAEALARAEPSRADYQRDLSISYERMGDLYRALGQGDAARDAFAKALTIREALARAEPARADYQDDLATSFERTGDALGVAGEPAAARDAYDKAVTTRERLALREPDRADYQRRLAVCLVRRTQFVPPGETVPGLQRALAILDALQASGRLNPADAGMAPALRQMLQQLEGQG